MRINCSREKKNRSMKREDTDVMLGLLTLQRVLCQKLELLKKGIPPIGQGVHLHPVCERCGVFQKSFPCKLHSTAVLVGGARLGTQQVVSKEWFPSGGPVWGCAGAL